MTLRWHLYDNLYDLKVIEAAFLWLEIEPTAELLKSPPYEVNIVQQLINSELSRRAMALLIDWEMDDPVGKLVIQLRITEIETKYITGQINHKERDFKIIQAEMTPVTQAERFNARAAIPSTFDTVSLKDLREIAIKLNEKPKFLFPEARGEDRNGWSKGEISKASYKELIRILCNEHGKINLGDKEAVSKIKLLAEKNGNGISDATIRSILDEVDPSRLNNSNRRTEKTK